jgi:hypothetical protein
MKLNPHDPVYSTDPDGTPIVGVRISNITTREERAWLYVEDYRTFVARHGLCKWQLHGYQSRGGYVETYKAGSGRENKKTLSVAHQITGTRPTRYKDKNPLNLRRPNLINPEGSREKRVAQREQQREQQGLQNKTYWEWRNPARQTPATNAS